MTIGRVSIATPGTFDRFHRQHFENWLLSTCGVVAADSGLTRELLLELYLPAFDAHVRAGCFFCDAGGVPVRVPAPRGRLMW